MKRDATLPSHLHICFSSCSIQFNFINPRGGNWFKGKKSFSDNKIRDIKMDSLWRRLRKRRSECVLRNFVWRPEWSLHCVHSFLKGAQNLFSWPAALKPTRFHTCWEMHLYDIYACVFILHQKNTVKSGCSRKLRLSSLVSNKIFCFLVSHHRLFVKQSFSVSCSAIIAVQTDWKKNKTFFFLPAPHFMSHLCVNQKRRDGQSLWNNTSFQKRGEEHDEKTNGTWTQSILLHFTSSFIYSSQYNQCSYGNTRGLFLILSCSQIHAFCMILVLIFSEIKIMLLLTVLIIFIFTRKINKR